ncbi:DUF554 domain-containing protein [Lewinella cohaerens]|uniref:DUF554 domain-containing protein n=1 Tax=Lewinella cohaerens TaxID=70995 RepID=UPI00037C6B42|nr:DUF554 domain-containing protein [Lewinella cohaerens]
MNFSNSKLPIGTLINMGTVTIGSLIGLYLQGIFPENIQSIIFQAIGLGTLVLGVMMSLKVPEGYLLNFIFSLILGGVVGELLGVQAGLQGLGDTIKEVLGITEGAFTEGLITAFLLFCIGSMTFVGAIEEGLEGKRDLLMVKSTLDGISSIAFASTYGIGVLFSIVPMLIFQGGITLMARQLQQFFTPTMIAQLSAVGGALIIGIGINILDLGAINVENLLPALLVTLPLTWLQQRVQATK